MKINHFVLSVLLLSLIGCGGGGASNSNNNPSPGPPVNSSGAPTGPWEYIATSKAKPGLITYVEVNFGTPNALVFQTLTTGNTTTLVGDTCNVGTPSMTVKTSGSTGLSGTFTIGAYVFTFSGNASSSSTASGTYSGGAGACADSGTFVANQASSLTGNYDGQLELQAGSDPCIPSTGPCTVTAEASLAEDGSFNIVVSGTVTVPSDTPPFTGVVNMNGHVIGNVATLTGTGFGDNAPTSVWLHNGNLYVTENEGAWFSGSLARQ